MELSELFWPTIKLIFVLLWAVFGVWLMRRAWFGK